MSFIKSIIPFEDKNEYLVITNDEKFLITKNDFNNLELSEGEEIDEELLELLVHGSLKLGCIKKAFSILSYSDHSSKKLADKLKKHFENEIVVEVIELFIQNNYLDDDALAIRLAEYYVSEKRWGPLKIKQELYQKGFSGLQIEDALESADDETFIENIVYHIQEKFPSIDFTDYKQKQKVIAVLNRKGFVYDLISEAILRLDDL